METETYDTVASLAERTKTSESFWRKAIARRALPVVRIGGRRIIRVKTTDAERFLAEGLRPARRRAVMRTSPGPATRRAASDAAGAGPSGVL